MKRMARLGLAVVALGLLLALPSQAAAFTARSGDRVSVSDAVNDDLYVVGTTIDVSGDVEGDVVAFGQNIRITGSVSGDVLAAGQTVVIEGSVAGSVRVAGQDVTVRGAVSEDVIGAGNTVLVTGDGSVGRDVVLAASTVTLDGDVARNVRAGAQRLDISGAVGGDIEAEVERLIINSGATVDGDVNYYSDSTARIDGDVRGETNRYAPRYDDERDRRPDPAVHFFLGVLGWIRGLIGMALFALLVMLAARPLVERAAHEAWYGRPLISGIIGLAIFAAAFPVALIVFIVGLLVGGWWIAFVWLVLVWLLMLVGLVVISLAIGSWVISALAHRSVHPMLAVLLGVLILAVVGAVPILGWLAYFVAMLVGMGALVLALWGASGSPGRTQVQAVGAPQAESPQAPPPPAPPQAPGSHPM